MARPARLAVTPLEDRTVPAGFGNAWIETNITVSFAPDGTDVGGAPSSLFRTLGARAAPAEWQEAIRAAFQEWAVPANLNFALVPDDGRPVGTPGPVQRSPFVGDVRVTARPLSDNVLAISNPFDLVSSWAGEIVLNSNKSFDTDGSAGAYDLRTVLLQEVGHVLGVDNSPDPGSVMYGHYGAPRAGLSAGDVAAVRALYGAREADRFDGNNGNGTFRTASPLTYVGSRAALGGADGTAGATPFVAAGDLTTAADVDVYAVQLPAGSTPTAVVQTGGISSARLKVSVFARDGAGGRLLATTATADPRGNYVLPFAPVAGVSAYFVRVEAADGAGPFAVGSYRLAVGDRLTAVPEGGYTTFAVTPGGTVAESADWAAGRGANDTTASALNLGTARESADRRWDFRGEAALGSAADADVYRVRSGNDSGDVLVVGVGTAPGGAAPEVAVLDGRGSPVAAEVLIQNGEATLIQIRGVKKNATYFVVVRAADPAAWAGPEGYQFGFDFRAKAVELDPLAAATLTAAQPQLVRQLDVTRSQGFRFTLAASHDAGAAPAAARLTVFDAAGQGVFTLVARSGQTTVGDVLLAPGAYTVVVGGATADGSPLQGLRVDARFLALTDPIGPALDDGYTAPTATNTGGTGGKTADPGYLWLAPATTGTGFLSATSLYSSPWW